MNTQAGNAYVSKTNSFLGVQQIMEPSHILYQWIPILMTMKKLERSRSSQSPQTGCTICCIFREGTPFISWLML